MTAMQVSHKLTLNASTCMSTLTDLRRGQLLDCLNPAARMSRLYWLTKAGARMQSRLRRSERRKPLVHDVPQVDWDLYGFVCFSHRAAIVSVLSEALQAATIKRRARKHRPRIRMSANNVRDALRLLLARGIVQRTTVPRRRHAHYELSPVCRDFPRLLREAEWVGS